MFGYEKLHRAVLAAALSTAPLTTLGAESANLSIAGITNAAPIECVAVHVNVQQHTITCKKKFDRTSPLLISALSKDSTLDVGLDMFRGDGTPSYYGIDTLKTARIVGVEQVLPDRLDQASAALPALESLTISASKMCFTYTDGGTKVCLGKATQ